MRLFTIRELPFFLWLILAEDAHHAKDSRHERRHKNSDYEKRGSNGFSQHHDG